MMKVDELYSESVELLKKLIAAPSFSKEENKTAEIIRDFFISHNISSQRKGNNVWAVSQNFDQRKPALLLNSHHDTVKPNPVYSRDPFLPTIENGKLFGLGSNDAGGPLVSLIAAFLFFYDRKDLKYNLGLAASAEEEISGTGGIESIWNDLRKIECTMVVE